MRHDKKNKESKITFSLLKKPGEVYYNFEDNALEINNSLIYYLENV